MTPPMLEVRVSWGGGMVSTEGYVPDHSDMTVLQPANQGGVNINIGILCHGERRKRQQVQSGET